MGDLRQFNHNARRLSSIAETLTALGFQPSAGALGEVQARRGRALCVPRACDASTVRENKTAANWCSGSVWWSDGIGGRDGARPEQTGGRCLGVDRRGAVCYKMDAGKKIPDTDHTPKEGKKMNEVQNEQGGQVVEGAEQTGAQGTPVVDAAGAVATVAEVVEVKTGLTNEQIAEFQAEIMHLFSVGAFDQAQAKQNQLSRRMRESAEIRTKTQEKEGATYKAEIMELMNQAFEQASEYAKTNSMRAFTVNIRVGFTGAHSAEGTAKGENVEEQNGAFWSWGDPSIKPVRIRKSHKHAGTLYKANADGTRGAVVNTYKNASLAAKDNNVALFLTKEDGTQGAALSAPLALEKAGYIWVPQEAAA